MRDDFGMRGPASQTILGLVVMVLLSVGTAVRAGAVDRLVRSAESAGIHRCDGKVATIVGTSGADVLIGTDADDIIVGLGGADVIKGIDDSDDDRACGGRGDDVMRGSGVHLSGGGGSDRLIDTGGLGFPHSLDGGPGNDQLRSLGSNADVRGGRGDDELTLRQPATDSDLRGGPGDDVLTAGPRNRVIYHGAPRRIVANLRTGIVRGQGRDKIIGAPRLLASPFGDRIVGDEGPNDVAALGGDDVIRTNGGNDTIFAGSGEDVIVAGGGKDWIRGDLGNDRLDGGGERDRLQGGAGDDSLQGSWADDELRGGAGNDVVIGGPGDDTVDGGSGTDRCFGEREIACEESALASAQ
jgi:Ca2+-binding RTX toxin-like protein